MQGRGSNLQTPIVLVLAVVVSGCMSTVTRSELAEEYFNLGNAYFESGELERSYEAYQRALAITDDLPAAGYNLARLHIDRGELGDALAVLDQLLEKDPENTLVLETKAYVTYLLDRIDQAVELYLRVLEMSPARTSAAYNVALVYNSQGQYEDAVSILERSLEFAEQDARYHWLLAEVAHASGREADALAALERFRRIEEDDAEEQTKLARRYFEWGYYLQAIDRYEELAIEAEDDSTAPFYLGAALLLATANVDRGFDNIQAALKAGFDDAEAYAQLMTEIEEISEADFQRLEELARDAELELPDEDDSGGTDAPDRESPSPEDPEDPEDSEPTAPSEADDATSGIYFSIPSV